jgi:hypothetical protein
MAGAKRRDVLDPKIHQILDRLGVTPQRLFDDHFGVAAGAISTTDRLQERAYHTDRPSIFAGLWKIDLRELHDRLHAKFDGLNRRYQVGYCYMIRQNGVVVHSDSGDWAQRPGDSEPPPGDPVPRPGNVPWRHSVTMNVASVSKFVTAIAIARLLRERRIPATKPVTPFLPHYWAKGPNVDRITFNDLLRHEAGLGQSLASAKPPSGPGDFATAKAQIAQGATVTGPGTYNYKNFNFVILRVLFATLTETLDASFAIPGLPPLPFGGGTSSGAANDDLWDAISAQAYVDYVNKHVFAPASIAPRDFVADVEGALGYETRPTAPGARLVTGRDGSGPSGWQLSTGEVVRLLDEFRTGAMMPAWRAEQVIQNLYGLDWGLSTKAGAVYCKGGREVGPTGTKGVDSAIYLMPRNANLAIFCNSLGRPPAVSPPPGSAAAGTVQPRNSHLDGIDQMIVDSIRFKFF